jgi:hypothetical protein
MDQVRRALASLRKYIVMSITQASTTSLSIGSTEQGTPERSDCRRAEATVVEP